MIDINYDLPRKNDRIEAGVVSPSHPDHPRDHGALG